MLAVALDTGYTTAAVILSTIPSIDITEDYNGESAASIPSLRPMPRSWQCGNSLEKVDEPFQEFDDRY